MRTRPTGRTYGRSVSLFINNWQCHLTTVDVYADGSVDCWGFVDRALFRGKLRSRWVVPAPSTGQELVVFNFGSTGVRDGKWLHSPRSIAREVEDVVRHLNPGMQNLLDMQGSDSEVRGKARVAKLGSSDKRPYRREPTGAPDILGSAVPILRVRGDAFELSRLVVYADGSCQLGADGELLRVGDVPSLYDRGLICNTAPAGSRVQIPGLGEFRPTRDFGAVPVRDRVGEVHDLLGQLNGEPGVVRTCATRFERYRQEPSPEAKAALREAYDAVPGHLRCYCGDMDTRDTAIRAVLYEEGQADAPGA